MDTKPLFPFPDDPEQEARVLDRYFAGESAEEERQAIDRWIETNPGLAEQVAALRYAAWYPTAARPTPASSVLLANLRAKIASEQRRSGRNASHLRSQSLRGGMGGLRNPALRWIGRLTLAAGVALAIGIVQSGKSSKGSATQTYATNAHQTASLILSDDTHVTLGPNTTLQLAAFGASSRTVTLTGEGYFNVMRLSGAPFMVRSGMFTVQALGTAFLVRHDAKNAHVHVAVAEGKINLASPVLRHAGWTLTAGNIGDVRDSIVRIKTVDDMALNGVWRKGEFEFRHARVSQILETLTRWYGYQFRFADSALVQQTVTAAISARSSSSALAVLEQVLDVNLAAVGDTITLIPHQSKSMGLPPVRAYDLWAPSREVGR